MSADGIRGTSLILPPYFAPNLLATALAQEVRMLRIDETLTPGAAGIDKISAIPRLAEEGVNAASDPAILAQIKDRFLNGILAEDWRQAIATIPEGPFIQNAPT